MKLWCVVFALMLSSLAGCAAVNRYPKQDVLYSQAQQIVSSCTIGKTTYLEVIQNRLGLLTTREREEAARAVVMGRKAGLVDVSTLEAVGVRYDTIWIGYYQSTIQRRVAALQFTDEVLSSVLRP